MRRLQIGPDLQAALAEVTPPGMAWQDIALLYLRGSVAEFWSNHAKGSGLDLPTFRERTRAFMREGDPLVVAIGKARQPCI